MLKIYIPNASPKVSDLVGDKQGIEDRTFKCIPEVSDAGESYLRNNDLSNTGKLFPMVSLY